MKKKYQTTFSKAIHMPLDAVPDHVMQNINDVCAFVLMAALRRDCKDIDPNLALAGIQKALAVLIANFFPQDQVKEIAEIAAKSVVSNAIAWSQEHEDNDESR